MPIDVPSNALYRIKSLNVSLSSTGYDLSMNYGKAQACVLCICRTRLITAKDLTLSEDDLNFLFSGGKMEFDDYTLQGISGQQLTALSQYREKDLLKPPAYVQAWSMAANPSDQNKKVLYIPEDPEEQMFLVPVNYSVLQENGGFTIRMEQNEGYRDGDLMYQVENRLPIPIPKSQIGRCIVTRHPQDKIRVIAEPAVAQNYILQK